MKKPYLPILLFLLVAIGMVTKASATTYFVNSNPAYGSDAHSGTSPTTAWKTLYEVMQHTFSPGDIIAFRRGQSWSNELGQSDPTARCVMELNGSGTDSAHIIRATCYDSDSGTGGVIGDGGSGALPIFYGIAGPNENGFCTVLLQNRQYWTLEDLDIRGGQHAALIVESEVAGTTASGITLRNLTIRDTDHYAYTGFSWFGDGILIYNDGANLAKFDNLVIDHCTIFNTWLRGIECDTSYTVPASTNAAYYDTNVQVTNNSISQTRTDGIFVSGCQDFLISGNTVDYAGNFQFSDSTRPSSGAIFWGSCYGTSSVGCRVQYNTVSNTQIDPLAGSHGYITDSMGFDLDIGNAGLHLLQYNLSHNNGGGFCEILPKSMTGLIAGVTDRFIVRFNISHHDDLNATAANLNYCMLIAPVGEHQEFYRNTFYCGTGPAIVNRRWPDDTNYPNKDGDFKDNIFYCPAGFYNCRSGVTTTNNTMVYDHDCFSISIPNGMFSGYNTNPVYGDPTFRNESSPAIATDLQLMTTSPCWNAGTNTGIPNPVPQIDYFAYAYDQGLTIGADVFEDLMRFRFENNLTDNSGHGNNGTFGGTGTTYGTGGQQHSGNYCLDFNGTGWVVTTNPTFGDELGVDLWVYPTSSGGYRRMVDKVTGGGHDGFMLDLNPTNNVRWFVGWYGVTSTAAVTLNQWNHVEGIYLRNGTMAVYVNGVLSGSTTVANDAVPNNAYNLRLGADQVGGQALVGRLDDVKVRKDSTVR